tara:strand:- start:444 stop:656 length:213 start_codon:yes stop_codon:yes gene_type:complete
MPESLTIPIRWGDLTPSQQIQFVNTINCVARWSMSYEIEEQKDRRESIKKEIRILSNLLEERPVKQIYTN